MAIVHLDCASGIAGDMFLGACLDLGLPREALEDAVVRLGLPGVALDLRKAKRGGFAGTRLRVRVDGHLLEGPDPDEPEAPEAHPHEHPHAHPHAHHHETEGGHPHPHGHTHGSRDLAEIRSLIATSALAPAVKERATALFVRLGEAEAKVHGVPLERVHFHEVGAVDSIVDLVGAAAAIEILAPERISASPVNVGGGRVKTAHGELAVPAPATALLLRGVPTYGTGGGELTTPTGAVLLAHLVAEYVEFPAIAVEAVGYGLGKKELPDRPNALRLLYGQGAAGTARPEVAVVECEVDDLPGEGFGFLMERLLEAGALDVYFTPVQMKKSRPGTLVTVLCRAAQLEPLAALLLMESGSLGCRYHKARRFEAEREVGEVATPYGAVRIKRAHLDGRQLAAAPEFEDCRRLALAAGVPWREVYRAALAAG